MPPLRRTQTIYVTLDPFLSTRGAVRHHFDEFLLGLNDAEFPCIWLTGLTRAQLDEPRRRLGHNDPFIGESGCGVYLPEDYFHLKSGNTIRFGRFTCIPVAKPQPAAAEALEELSSDLGIAAVSLQNLGSFWSFSVGADYAKCIRELGALYDRALRYHAFRVGVAVTPTDDAAQTVNSDMRLKSLAASCDRTYFLAERHLSSQTKTSVDADQEVDDEAAEDVLDDVDEDDSSSSETPSSRPSNREHRSHNSFQLHSPDVWENVLAAILARR